MPKIRMQVRRDINSAEADDRVLTFVLSSNSADRVGDVIDQNGWMLDNYKANPVVLWAHDSRQPPVGKCVNMCFDNKGSLKGDVHFATKDANPFAEQVYRLCKGGFLNAGSVGFIAHEYDAIYNEDGNFSGIHYRRCELTEFSICPVPMNPDALAVARSLGAPTDLLSAKMDADDYPAVKAALLGQHSAAVKLAALKGRVSLNASKSKLL